MRTLRFVVVTVLALCVSLQSKAVVEAGEYYIYSDFFKKPLGSDGTTPKLVTYAKANDDAFIFVAEASGTDGYVKLKQKSSGLYLTASTSNSYSVLLSASGSGDQYLWALDQLFSTKVVSKKNTGKRLGCDFSTGWGKETVPVYYDKGTSAMNWFSIIPANGNGFESSRLVCKTGVFTNEYGVTEQDDYQVDEAVQVNGIDYHIISNTPFITGGSVNLNGEHSWLVFENNRPSNVKSSWLKYVTIDGQPARVGTNCRVEIYLKGAAVIPTPASDPFVATTDNGKFGVKIGNSGNLGENSNKARSFVLKRGYMATVASGANGGDYSRVYVADHADLEVTLPTPLDRRVTSVWVRNWHYTSKSGYGGWDTSAAKTCGTSWYWNWDANQSSSDDLEYIPIKQHKYWPDNGNFWNNSFTAMMLFNEPEHSEQHNDCSCGGTIDEWTAYTLTKQFNQYGVRIGSPSATDLSYIQKYVEHCNNMKQRCDFTCTHGYWTSEWDNNLNTLKNMGRPVWITEWEYGASWITSYTPSSADEYAGKVLSILDKLEYNKYVERYSYYGTDLGGTNGWMREIFWDSNYQHGNAPTGQVLDRVKPHLGYDKSVQATPNWWAPSFDNVSISKAVLSDGKYVLTVKNPNGDATKTLDVMRKNSNGEWESVYSLDRAQMEPTTLTLDNIEGLSSDDVIKVVVTSLFTEGTKESAEVTLAPYHELGTMLNLRFDEGVATTANVDVSDKDGMQNVDGWVIQSTSSTEYRAGARFEWGSGKTLKGSALPSQNSEGTTTGGALGLLAAWGNTSCYNQYVVLEPGIYTMTVPVYKAAGTEQLSKNLIGFISDAGREYLATTTNYTASQWTTETIRFVLLEETPGHISVGYTSTNTGSTNQPRIFADYVDIQREDIKPDYSSFGNLQNLTFNTGTFVSKSVLTYQKDITTASAETARMQAVDGWTIVENGDARASGQFAWGTGKWLGGADNPVPAKNSEETKNGGALGILSVWSAKTQYTQNVTLPIGRYTITIPYYNVGGTGSVNTNLFGFVADNGKTYYASEKTFATGGWKEMSISFELAEETAGKLSLGYTAANAGSGSMPHLFIDYVKITDSEGRTWPTVGDANFDGGLSIGDVAHTIKSVKDGIKTYLERMDVDGDGKITLSDILQLVETLKVGR